jgi:hypothetical protein
MKSVYTHPDVIKFERALTDYLLVERAVGAKQRFDATPDLMGGIYSTMTSSRSYMGCEVALSWYLKVPALQPSVAMEMTFWYPSGVDGMLAMGCIKVERRSEYDHWCLIVDLPSALYQRVRREARYDEPQQPFCLCSSQALYIMQRLTGLYDQQPMLVKDDEIELSDPVSSEESSGLRMVDRSRERRLGLDAANLIDQGSIDFALH